jgi:UDP-glucose 4-epimerase
MKKNILVFGAAGFMGTYLVEALINCGYNVTASDINELGRQYYKEKGIHYIEVDITKEDDFSKLGDLSYYAVIHLAAHQPANVSAKTDNPIDYIKINVIGVLNVLSYCNRNKVGKIIYASSHRNTQGLWLNNSNPLSEDDGRSIKFDTEYTMFSISESAAQDCVLYYQEKFGLKGIIFRLPPVYGYGPHNEIFKNGKQIKTGFQSFIDNAIANQPIEIWGDSEKGRDIIYIKDVISAFIQAIEINESSGLYNIASGYKLTLKEEVETIARVFWGSNSKPVIIYKPEVDNGIDSFCYDISKAKKELNWAPIYSFEDMLNDFIIEEKSKKYSYLLDKRKQQFEIDNNN